MLALRNLEQEGCQPGLRSEILSQNKTNWAVVAAAHAFSPSTQEAEAEGQRERQRERQRDRGRDR